MPETFRWSFAAQVAGGPTVGGSGSMEVDAYTKLSVTVPAGGARAVEVFPGGGAAAQVVVIAPDAPSPDVSYEVDGNAVPLDGPHVLIGAGAVSLLAGTLGTLTFSNATARDVHIDILVGRDATP